MQKCTDCISVLTEGELVAIAALIIVCGVAVAVAVVAAAAVVAAVKKDGCDGFLSCNDNCELNLK